MWNNESGALLRKVLPTMSKTEDIRRLIKEFGIFSRFKMDLDDSTERSKIDLMKRTILSQGIISSEWAGDAETLANILYFDICDRQSSAIASEVVRNDELGAEYYAAIFIHLVDNYRMVGKDYHDALVNAGFNLSIYDAALDIIFASRFDAFERYDIWDASEPTNARIRQSHDRMMLSLLNNDICIGAFWDERISLKNSMVRERLQVAIDILQRPDFDFMGSELSSNFGKYGDAFLGISEKSHATLRLIDIAEGKCSELSSFVFVCDHKKLDTLSSKIQKVTSMIKLKEFVETTDNPPEKKSLYKLVSELQKLRGLKCNGERIE